MNRKEKLRKTVNKAGNLKKEQSRIEFWNKFGDEKEFLQTLIEEIPAGIAIAEAPSGKLVLRNKYLEKIFRRPFIYSGSFSEYKEWKGYHPDGKPYKDNEWPMARSIIKGEVVEGEDIVIDRGDGTRGLIKVRSAPIRDSRGNIVAGVVVDVDITESSLTEQRRDSLVNVVSHELKTPLTSLMVYLGLINKLIESPTENHRGELKKHVERIEQQVERLAKIVDELLDITNMTEGQFKLKREEVRLGEVIDLAIKSVKSKSGRGRIKTSMLAQVRVVVDKSRLCQAIECLLSNALKYSPPKELVEVKVWQEGNEAVVMVKDKGIGIDNKFKDKLYQRYWRVYENKDDTFPGLGIGLYLAAEIIKMHGGRIWHDSRPGKGARFYFSLPIVEGISTDI